MAELIVNFLEVVEVEQNHGKRIAGAFGSRDFFFQAQLSEAAVVKAGQRIENRKIVEFVGLDAMLGDDLNLPLQHGFCIAMANHRVRAAHADQ